GNEQVGNYTSTEQSFTVSDSNSTETNAPLTATGTAYTSKTQSFNKNGNDLTGVYSLTGMETLVESSSRDENNQGRHTTQAEGSTKATPQRVQNGNDVTGTYGRTDYATRWASQTLSQTNQSSTHTQTLTQTQSITLVGGGNAESSRYCRSDHGSDTRTQQ